MPLRKTGRNKDLVVVLAAAAAATVAKKIILAETEAMVLLVWYFKSCWNWIFISYSKFWRN